MTMTLTRPETGTPTLTDEAILAGLDFDPQFPFMNAPGSVNGANEELFIKYYRDLVRAAGAVVMIGSVTMLRREGNEAEHGAPVYLHFEKTGLTYNSMGLPNLGIERMAQLIPDLKLMADDEGKKLAISLAPMTKNPAEEWIKMATMALEAGAHIIEYNAGCPNIYDAEGNPKAVLSLDPDVMGEALETVQDELGLGYSSGVKLSPAPVSGFGPEDDPLANSAVTRHQARVLNKLAIVKYVALYNTFGGQVPVDENGKQHPLSVLGGAGGVSGPGVGRTVQAQSLEMLDFLNNDIDIVAAGGINTGQELADRLAIDKRIKMGSAVTALWEAPTMGAGATRIAQEYAEAA